MLALDEPLLVAGVETARRSMRSVELHVTTLLVLDDALGLERVGQVGIQLGPPGGRPGRVLEPAGAAFPFVGQQG